MKHLFKKIARPLWRISAPGPATRHSQVRSSYDAAPCCADPPLMPPPAAPADLDLALNSVVRELARLQMQVEILQEQIDDLQSSDRVGPDPRTGCRSSVKSAEQVH